MYIVSNYKVPLLVIWDLFLNDFLGGLFTPLFDRPAREVTGKGREGTTCSHWLRVESNPRLLPRTQPFLYMGCLLYQVSYF